MSTPTCGAPSRTLVRVIKAGLAAGLVDLVYATARGLADAGSITLPWRGVASGWIGRAAFDEGLAPVGLGLATHFAVALVMATVWIIGPARLEAVQRRRLAAAAVYGLGLYVAMYLIVLPLRWPGVFPRWEGVRSVLDILAHVAVALVIAWIGRPECRRARAAGAAE